MSDEPSDRAATFDALFARDADPWAFETSEYEKRKRAATIAALHGARFSRALEVGCASGVLTAELAPFCDRMLAIDVSERALAIARRRITPDAAVEFARAEVPREWPTGAFDLIVLSEVLYFLSAEEIRETSQKASECLAAGGLCLLVNWTGPNDLPVSGTEAVRLFASAASWRTENVERADTYRIDRLFA